MKPARLEQIRTICAQRNSVPAMVTAIDELLDEVHLLHETLLEATLLLKEGQPGCGDMTPSEWQDRRRAILRLLL